MTRSRDDRDYKNITRENEIACLLNAQAESGDDHIRKDSHVVASVTNRRQTGLDARDLVKIRDELTAVPRKAQICRAVATVPAEQ